uniref:S-formylglutathione hydrolase n=1 Tax=Oncorhynchus kisutch TaxID=8019 RepID=A0A8C7GMA1_ONCKI
MSLSSTELKCQINFSINLPPKTENGKCPQNFITNAGSQQAASEHGTIIVAPDTSPLTTTPTLTCSPSFFGSWDFGTGAVFYANATQEPWKTLPRSLCSFFFFSQLSHLINANFPTDQENMYISALKNPGKHKACLCFLFATICNPSQKAFNGYLGKDKKAWEFLSASHLLPDNLIASCSEKIPVVFRLQPGYDHSYFFINDHIKHHAKFLNP